MWMLFEAETSGRKYKIRRNDEEYIACCRILEFMCSSITWMSFSLCV